MDTTSVAAQAAAVSAAITAGGGGTGCTTAAGAAAEAAAAAAVAAAAMAPAACSTPTSAAAAAMLNINVCSTALAALAPRVADLAAVNAEFLDVMEQTDGCLDARCAEGAAAANARKNRYANILPYDSNRVPLEAAGRGSSDSGAAPPAPAAPPPAAAAAAPPPAAGSGRKAAALLWDEGQYGGGGCNDYFNGSFIRDPSVDGTYACGYVATQGPLPTTIADFWQAMRVAQCSAIVMLTNYVDYGRAKCAPYFPKSEGEEMALPEGIRIECVHKTQLSPDLVIRQLEVMHPVPGGHERQWINHYHYTTWPDHGVPRATDGVRRLCHALDDCRRASCHIAVHCSAGVGRTGAFVAIDMLLQRLQRLRLQPPGAITAAEVQGAVDVQNLVLALRRQRWGMVQTGAQYEFVFHALMDDVREGIEAGQEMLLVEAEEAGQQEAATGGGGSGGKGAAGGPAAQKEEKRGGGGGGGGGSLRKGTKGGAGPSGSKPDRGGGGPR